LPDQVLLSPTETVSPGSHDGMSWKSAASSSTSRPTSVAANRAEEAVSVTEPVVPLAMIVFVVSELPSPIGPLARSSAARVKADAPVRDSLRCCFPAPAR
jgi:hypothetical protein